MRKGSVGCLARLQNGVCAGSIPVFRANVVYGGGEWAITVSKKYQQGFREVTTLAAVGCKTVDSPSNIWVWWQLGSLLALEARSCRFESCHPDQYTEVVQR